MKVALPGFQPRRKLTVLTFTYVAATFLLILTARFHIRQPVALPWTALDAAIPLVPWSIFLYCAHFPFVYLALYFLKDRDNMNRVAASMILATALSLAIFVVYPTVLPPRAPFHFRGPVGALFNLIYAVDTPYSNCFPSLHVAYSTLAALGYRDEQRRRYPFMLACAALISISTTLTKQHYFIDVPAGVLLAFACRALVDRRVEFRFDEARAPR